MFLKWLFCCVLLWGCQTLPLLAFTDTYVVRNIKVDARANSAVAAQEKALLQGRQKALLILISRLSDSAEVPDLDALPADNLEDLVLDYEVKQQKNSAVRYIATLDFRFDEAAVKSFLKNQNFQSSGGRKDSLVVVPVLEQTTATKLWESENPWFTAWSKQKNFQTSHPILVPMGDLTDISDVSPEQATSQDIEALHQLARRYGAGGALLAVAHLQEDGALEIDITVTTLAGTLQQKTITVSPPTQQAQNSGTNTDWIQAIDQTIATLKSFGSNRVTVAQADQDVAEKPVEPLQERHPLNVTVPLDGLYSWMNVQKILKDIPVVERVTLKSISKDTANLEVGYSGSLPALESALGARGFKLSQGQDSRWILSAGTDQTTSAY